MNKAIQLILTFALLFEATAFAAPDYNKPANTSTKTGFPVEIRENIADVAKMDFSTASNIPTNSLRYNRNTDMVEQYNGSTWDEMPVGSVGTIISQFATTAPTGYLILAGGTIGNASSGATLRANADTTYLFTHLWTNLTNSEAPVSGGRGASAAADFAANKTITLPDMRQRFPLGRAASGTGSTLGGTGGNIDHTHTGPSHTHDMANHTHTMANHTHTITHTHNMGNHTHSTPNHTHAAGNLRAQIGSNVGTNEHIFMALDGGNTFTSGYRYSASGSTLTAISTTVASTVVQGSTATDGSGTSGTPSTNVTDGTNTANSGTPSTNTSDGPSTNTTSASGTGATGTGNPPFLTMNFFIKY